MKKNFHKLFLALVATLTLFALAACSKTSSTSSQSSSSDKVTIKTSTGDTELASNPKKIVVLDYGAADTIRALGYEDSIVGMPTDSLPSYLSDFNAVAQPAIEAFLKE